MEFWPEDKPLFHPMMSREEEEAIESVQRQVDKVHEAESRSNVQGIKRDLFFSEDEHDSDTSD